LAQLQETATRVKAPPQTNDIQALRDYVRYLADIIAILGKNLDYIINGNLDANNIRANSIETRNLKAGAVTAEKINVDELSAISANLGHILAGIIESVQIYGSRIATSASGYPRIELSPLDNLLTAFYTATNLMRIFTNFLGNPALVFNSDTITSFIANNEIFGSSFEINTNQTMNITVGNSLYFNVNGFCYFPSWNQIYSNYENQTLKQALDAIQTTLQNQINGLSAIMVNHENRISALEGP
jgi:hypothetical protein